MSAPSPTCCDAGTSRDTALFLHRELLAHLDRARAETGLDLPGPIADLAPDDVLVTRPVSTKENLR